MVEKNFLHKNQKMWGKSPPKNVQVPADPRLLWHVSAAVLVVDGSRRLSILASSNPREGSA